MALDKNNKERDMGRAKLIMEGDDEANMEIELPDEDNIPAPLNFHEEYDPDLEELILEEFE